ncbi:MAG: ATP-binding protein [Verrucomicrobiia bacterium]
MRIAVASGKGGTGKTTIATSLAVTLTRHGQSVAYLDCDVEEPNGHLFLKPCIQSEGPVVRLLPQVDADRCALCGVCARFCQFGAMVCLGERVVVFSELCHACGGCAMVCPNKAISEVLHRTGTVRTGECGKLLFVDGRLNVGEPSGPPVIHVVKQTAPEAAWTVLDAPPGTGCPVVETLRGSDYVLLVTEPTPFGLHDLKLAVDLVRALELPCGVVINRAGTVFRELDDFLEANGIEVLARLLDDRAVAEAYACGELICDAVPGWRDEMEQLVHRLSSPVCVTTS